MKLIQINKDVWFNPEQVVSVAYEVTGGKKRVLVRTTTDNKGFPSGYSMEDTLVLLTGGQLARTSQEDSHQPGLPVVLAKEGQANQPVVPVAVS